MVKLGTPLRPGTGKDQPGGEAGVFVPPSAGRLTARESLEQIAKPSIARGGRGRRGVQEPVDTTTPDKREDARNKILQGRIDTLQQKIDLGRLSQRQIDFLQRKISNIRTSIGVTAPSVTTVELREETFVPERPDVIPDIDFERPREETFVPELGGFIRKSEPSGQATGFIRPATPSEKLEIEKASIAGSAAGLEVALFPALVGPKFLSSQLAQQQLRGKIEEDEREEVEKTQDLIARSGTLDPRNFIDKRKAALELLRVMKNKNKDIETDQRRAENLAKVMEKQNIELNKIAKDLENETISNELAAKRQNDVINKFKSKGFNISQADGSVEITHPVFNRLNRFGSPAWSRLLKQAKKSDSPIIDQSLIAGLDLSNKAYTGAKILLGFQLAGSAATAAGLALPKITGSAASLRLLNIAGKGAGVSILPSFALLEGAKARAETGETLLAISSTLGTLAGIGGGGKVIGNIRLRNQLKGELEAELSKMSPARREAFKDYMKQTQALQRFEPKANNIKLNNIESIEDPKAQKAIRDFLKTNKKKVVVGGSVAQTGQVKVIRKLGDMDLYVEGGLTESQAARQLAKQLKDAGVDRVSVIRGQVTIAGKKAIEFHDIERLLTNIRQVTPDFSDPRGYIIKTPEGIRIQRIALQARRKLVAAFADPKRFATGKYAKDLKDFKSISEKLVKNAEKTIIESGIIKPRGTRAFEKAFGKVTNIKVKGVFRKPSILRDIPKKPFGGTGRVVRPKVVRKVPLTRKAVPSQVKVKGVFRKPPILIPSQNRVRSGFKLPKVVPSQPGVKKFVAPKPVPFAGFKKVVPSQPPVSKQLKIPRVLPSQPGVKKRVAIPPGLPSKKSKERKRQPFPRDFPTGKPSKPKKEKKVTKPKNFQVFVTKNKKPVLVKSFKTAVKAEEGIRKKLSGTLRASGYIFDKKKGVKIKPIIKNPKKYRVGKKDPFLLVERRNQRITKNTGEVREIQASRKASKPFKLDKSPMSKRLKKVKKKS